MIDICLKNKIIYGFLKNFKHKKWNNIIPSLLEIAILNLYSSFKRYIFSEEDLSLIILNLKSKNYIPLKKELDYRNTRTMSNNNKTEKLNLDITKFRKNLQINSQDALKWRNYSYRSFPKKPKNINELNIYSNNNKEKKRNNHYDNLSNVVTPIKDLINYNETDLSVSDSNGNIYKLYKSNTRLKKNPFKLSKKSGNKIINCNTEDHCNFINDKINNIYNRNKSLNVNLNLNRNMNYSYSIDYKRDKNYIKVKINNNSNKKTFDKNINEDKKIIKRNNNELYSNGIREINSKTNLFNKTGKMKIINEYKKRNKNNLDNYNKEQTSKIDENKKNIFLNNNIYYRDKKNINNLNKTLNSCIIFNSPRIIEYKGICKLQRFINGHNHNNQKKLYTNKSNLKEIKTLPKITFSKNIKQMILYKAKRKDNNNNINIIDEINQSTPNINNRNLNSSSINHNSLKNNEQLLFQNNKGKKIINYNSFNNCINTKHSISLNDPYLFKKSPRIKNNYLRKKINNTDANGKIDNNI